MKPLKQKITRFDERVESRLDDAGFVHNDVGAGTPYIEDIELTETRCEAREGIIPSDDEYGNMIVEGTRDADEFDDYDKYIGAQLLREVGDEIVTARVVKRARGADGQPIGRSHSHPMFDTRKYIIEYPDGAQEEYTANMIAENIYSSVDSEGKSFAIMKEITDHRRDNSALKPHEGFVISRNGNRVPKRTTRGWKLLVEWKDGSSEWICLKDLKDSNPVELADYAVANKIDTEPAFHWWVPYVLRRWNRIISKVKNKYWRTTHKFGIRLPHSVEEALQIDKDTGTNFWGKAIEKERQKVKVAWEAREDLSVEECRAGR
ncbi:MAG: hypothetical protein AAF587_45000, partial [Bacteroidota bacterium]